VPAAAAASSSSSACWKTSKYWREPSSAPAVPATVILAAPACRGEDSDLSKQAPLSKPFFQGPKAMTPFDLQVCQENPPIQIIYKGALDLHWTPREADGPFRPRDAEPIRFLRQTAPHRASMLEKPDNRAAMGLVDGESAYRWNAAEHNKQRWDALSRDLASAAAQRQVAAEGAGPAAAGTRHISLSTFNGGAYRGHIEKYRCGAFHILLGQEADSATPAITSRRMAEIELEGFTPIRLQNELVAVLSHLY